LKIVNLLLAGIFGNIQAPSQLSKYSSAGSEGQGLFLFLSNAFKFAGVIAGIILVVQFITAGYMYISANGDSKKTEQAWAKIWQAILGLVIVASAFTLAAVIGRLLGFDILNPTIN